jgi:hypothetical protein
MISVKGKLAAIPKDPHEYENDGSSPSLLEKVHHSEARAKTNIDIRRSVYAD